MSNNAPIVYFKGLRLGDFKSKAETVKLLTQSPDFQNAIGGSKSFVWDNSANASFEVAFSISLKSGFTSAEASHVFWARVRTFFKNLASIVNSGDSQFGVLSFVRDPDGSAFGKRDKTASTGVITAGSAVKITVSDAVNWGGAFALIADQTDPSKYEIVTISSTSVGTSEITIATLANSYSNIVDICRLEWWWTECALVNPPSVQHPGPVAVGFAQDIEFTFKGVVDFSNGVLS